MRWTGKCDGVIMTTPHVSSIFDSTTLFLVQLPHDRCTIAQQQFFMSICLQDTTNRFDTML
jgi:hypothetical protein